MEKPLIIQLRETKEKISNLTNEALKTIPAELLADYFGTLQQSMRDIAEEQYKMALEKYNEEVEG